MTIRSVSAIPVSLPFDIYGPKPMLAGKPRMMEFLLIRVETEDGRIGWGEAFGFAVWPATKTVIETLIDPAVRGKNEADIAQIHDELSRKYHLLGRTGPVMYALSGLDIALWDLAGKAADKSLSELLGGRKRESVAAYASLMKYTDPDVVARNSAKAANEGYGIIKLHETGVEQIRRSREAIGPGVKLTVDVNCPWTAEQAIAICEQTRELDLYWLEEPVWPPEDYRQMARVRKEGKVAIAAGENASTYLDFQAMFEAGAVDFAQPSVTKIGGITELLRVAELARRHGVAFAPHSPYMGPGLIATIHVLAACNEEIPLEYCFCDVTDNPVAAAISVRDARLAVPAGPGLGCDPDLRLVEKYRVN